MRKAKPKKRVILPDPVFNDQKVASTPLATGTKLYLYNPGADGFFVGANEWGTRASFSNTVGHKVILEPSTDDANSYLITNAADDADTFLPLYIKDVNGVWVDESGENTGDDLFTFNAQGGDTYTIGLSALNKEFNPTNFKDTYINWWFNPCWYWYPSRRII